MQPYAVTYGTCTLTVRFRLSTSGLPFNTRAPDLDQRNSKPSSPIRDLPNPLESLSPPHDEKAEAQLETLDLKYGAGTPPFIDETGATLWRTGRLLCDFLYSRAHAAKTSKARIAELGAGSGLPGLLLAALGFGKVLLTDNHPEVVKHLQEDIRYNGLTNCCSALALDWCNPVPDHLQASFDLVVASDVVYSSRYAVALAETVPQLLSERGVFLLAHELRYAVSLDPFDGSIILDSTDEPFELFSRCMEQARFVCKELIRCPLQAGEQPGGLLSAWALTPEALLWLTQGSGSTLAGDTKCPMA